MRDTFGTERLRESVLEAWTASSARFREDANAEQDLALGGYRDRLVVELAQNASDAAARAGVPGRLRLGLADGKLTAANTGEPLDAAGVESLSTLRASAKRTEPDQGAVGRFGVGFSAVLAVTDEPAVVTRTGTAGQAGDGVRWSLAEARELTRQAAAANARLAEELDHREGHVPLLRLPLPAPYQESAVPSGYDTAVLLPLRDEAAHSLTRQLLAAVDDALLLALPGLAEVVIDTGDGPARTLTRHEEDGYVLIRDSAAGATRWRLAGDSGVADPELLADRPVEERARPTWSVTWAVPVDEEGAPAKPRTAACLHAPTPTDEPLGFPALLLASFPLEPTRRHVAPGPLTRFLLHRAADAYAALLRDWRPVTTSTVELVPGPLGAGELDGELRALVLERLPDVPFLASAATGTAAEDDTEQPYALRPRDAEIVEGAGAATVAVLSELFPSLLPAGLERRTELRVLEVPRVPLGEAVDRLTGVEREPGWWWRLYDSLAGVDPERLTGLPVPLADGRTAVGPRHVLLPLPDGAVPPERMARLGLKAAHPDAAHPLLEKLGATPATPRAVLTTPQVRAAVAASLDAEEAWDDGPDGAEGGGLDPDELAETVLGLVRDAHLAPGDEPWLGALALPDEDGEPAPAAELVYPGSPFARVLREDELATCDAQLAERWGEQPLTAVGVQADFALVRAEDVVLDPDGFEPREGDYPEPDDPGLLDAVDVWCEDVLDQLAADGDEGSVPPVAVEFVAVRDLDLVDDAHWPEALAMLARPPLRDALTAPVRVRLGDGTVTDVRPYTAWWLRGHPVLDGRRPAGLRSSGGDPLLRGLYEEADPGDVTDEGVLRALGVRTTAAALLAEPGGPAELLRRLADPALPVDPAQLHGLYTLLATAGLDPAELTLPDELRAVRDGTTVVVDAAEALVADAPDALPLVGDRPLLPVAAQDAGELAALLEVRCAGEEVAHLVPESAGTEREVPAVVRELLPGAPDRYREHEELRIGGVDLDWRRTPDGTLHAATLEGLASALAWSAGAWPRRFEVPALLEDPARAAELAAARWFD
ncbi:sacsin N-terminal ATP-binding-like domain-containing protein [Streptomyces sp. B15]|uniref:sacsin N-terminal ATP-binding-like domain-containing protein n=1 Tax=Streptomyces sp. B15 TaxID=1537797 RepID=UPI001B36A5E2|nr:molecular chaperone Hsp90 [Streptomyces sp. B15]MBQ1119125.1 molecular chaperone Hsp90 [Streptomyces sp. B15]